MKQKFLEEATTPLAKRVGNTISSIWSLVFGNIDVYAEKKEFERQLNLQNFKQELEHKLSSIPEEKITEPPLHVLGPTLEASKYYFECEELRSMFANLVASSINIDTAPKAHPSFVEIIKQLSPDEARILKFLSDNISKPIIKIRALDKYVDHYSEPIKEYSLLPFKAGCEYPELGPSYLVNIARLGLAEISYTTYNVYKNAYEPLENDIFISNSLYAIKKLDKRVEIIRGTFQRTNFGAKFYEACILEK